jgi:hypothetical protein
MFDTWQELIIGAVALLGSLGIIYAIISKGGGFKSKWLEAHGKPVPVKKTALTDGEIERIAERISLKMDEHKCKYGDIIKAGSALFEPLTKTTVALAEEAIERGKNGRIKEGREILKDKLANFEEKRDARAMA